MGRWVRDGPEGRSGGETELGSNVGESRGPSCVRRPRYQRVQENVPVKERKRKLGNESVVEPILWKALNERGPGSC